MKRLFLVVLCLCLCVALSSCKRPQSESSVDDSYLEGIDQGREDFFLEIWKSYVPDFEESGDLWETDDFSLRITANRGQWYGSDENESYLEVDFTIHGERTIEEYCKYNDIVFCIYSYGDYGWARVWDSYFYYDYFALQDGLDGNKGSAEVGIKEGTSSVAVLIVINGNLYTALIDVDF